MKPLPPLDSADLDYVVDTTSGLWAELRGQRLFVAGGTGFFGCWLLETFIWANRKLNLGASVTVLTRDPDAFKLKSPHLTADPAVRLHQGDVRSFEFPTGQFSHIIHAAAESSARLNAEQPLTMFDTIVQGTRHVLDFAVAGKARKLLLTSSGAVYGRQPPELTHIPEDYPGAPDPMNPGSAYGEGKRAAEKEKIELVADRVKIVQVVENLLSNALKYSQGGGPVRVNGDGTPCRSYLYAADLAIWLWTILFRGETCRPYNVGSEEAITIKSLATQVAASFKPKPAVLIAKTATPGQTAERYVPLTRRAASELALLQRIDSHTAVTRTITWYRRADGNDNG